MHRKFDFIITVGNYNRIWSKVEKQDSVLLVRGYAFYNGTLLKDQELAQFLFDAINSPSEDDAPTKLKKILSSIDGFFAAIFKSDNFCIGIVDRVRSIPLFYAKRENSFEISDNPQNLLSKESNNNFNDEATLEFLLAGYVTGNDTLYSEVSQIGPGQLTFAHLTGNDMQSETVSYFVYFDEKELSASDAAHEEELYNKIEDVFDRYRQLFSGKQLLVPLSGGLDSRLIVAMLNRSGIKDVICYSYGNPADKDSQISRDIAHFLGYQWRFVPYTGWKFWSSLYQDSLYYNYVTSAGAFSSIAHAQDWPAIRHLINEFGDSDTIIVPGHTGDFLSGGHLPVEMCKDYNGSDYSQLTADSIFSHHYNLWEIRDSFPEIKGKVINRIKRSFFTAPHDISSAAKSYEQWEWGGRQSRFIINSVRVYDFFKQNWAMPLWDNVLMDFFMKLGTGEKYQKRVYINTLLRKVFTGDLLKLAEIPVLSTTKLVYGKRGNFLVPNRIKKVGIEILLNLPMVNQFAVMFKNYWTDVFGIYGYYMMRDSKNNIFKPLKSILPDFNLGIGSSLEIIIRPNLRKPILVHSLRSLASVQSLFRLMKPQ